MTKSLSDADRIAAYVAAMTDEDRLRILRQTFPYRYIEVCGYKKEHLLTVFRLMEPISSSNNQRTHTDVFQLADKIYHVTYNEEGMVVEEKIPNDI